MKDIQTAIYHSLFTVNKRLDFIQSDDAEQRFAIYENTILSTLIRSLNHTYPGIWKLLGADCAKAMARRYLNAHDNFPITGCLDDWGATFPQFLSKQPELKNILYLEDYAQLEWQIHRVSICQEQPEIIPASFLAFDEQQLNNLQIQFVASVILLKSDHNLKAIYDLLHDEERMLGYFSHDESVLLSKQNCYILLYKSEHKYNIFWLQQDIWQFLVYLQSERLGKSVILTEQLTKNFDLVSALNFIIVNGLIAHLEYS